MTSTAPSTRPTRSGAALFARYAYPPNELGHCGPPGSQVLLAGGAGADGDRLVRAMAEQFDGAWPYLSLLATAAGIDDPLDERVVHAYWVGGDLLDRLDPETFARAVGAGFGGQPGVEERLAQTPAVAVAGANHVFHVFVVYPWVGLLGSDSDVPQSVLETCRVRWGVVHAVGSETAAVRSRPLTYADGLLALGDERVEAVRWSQGRYAFVDGLQAGDQVSLHWDWICDRLTDDDVAALADRTERQLASTNDWLAIR